MKYENPIHGKFIRRLNRFLAEAEIGGKRERCHVKNTGRLAELLIPGAEAVFTYCAAERRKTAYDLVSVRRGDGRLVNVDSLAPNRIAEEYLPALFPGIAFCRREYPFGNSRLDLYAERAGQKPLLIEVKGVTLLKDGTAFFPDAPTERGVKHLHELTAAAGEGYDCHILFVAQMRGAKRFAPNDETHPAFGQALREAVRAGVGAVCVECDVSAGEVAAVGQIPVIL